MPTLSVNESITLSEHAFLLPTDDVLRQDGFTIKDGVRYRLQFDANLTTGHLRVYQGSQLIYDSRVYEFSFPYEPIFISESVTISIV